MKTTLEKWLLFFGVLLFCWLVVPELEASAAEYLVDCSEYGGGVFTVEHTISGNTHTFSVDGYDDIVMTLTDEMKYIACYKFYKSGMVGVCIQIFKDYDEGFGLNPPYLQCVSDKYNNYWAWFEYSYPVGFFYFDTSTGDLIRSYYDSLRTKEYYLGFTQCNGSISYFENAFFYSNFDVYRNRMFYDSGLVFQRPLPTPTPSPQQRFQTAVEMTNLEAVMIQVVGLAPLLIGLLTTLFGFSKGLRLLFQTLRQA